MKVLLAAIFFILATTITSASEKAYHFGTVLNKFESLKHTSTLDLTTIKNSLFSGRCFSNNSQFAYGAALVLTTVTTDSGPIGSPDEKVSLGTYLTNINPSQFDDVRFNDVTTGSGAVELGESFHDQVKNISYVRNLALRQDTDGIFYALEYAPYSDAVLRTCYFFKSNN